MKKSINLPSYQKCNLYGSQLKYMACMLLWLSIAINGVAQTTSPPTLNLNFEEQEKNYPKGWTDFGSNQYKIYMDSVVKRNGKYAVVIDNSNNLQDYKALSLNLPHNYIGKKIKLTGYIKTENVSDGFAGLWVRIDPEVGFDNMQDRGITGSTDWTKYEITLMLEPEKTKQIVLGGLLVGKGKMWLDDLQVTVDDKTLDSKKLEIFKRELLPADKDSTFNKGSGITMPTLTKKLESNLELLGRIWGFVKYHHPEVAKGKYQWDFELFRILPEYLKATNNQERDKVLTNWLTRYGPLEDCKGCSPTKQDAVLKPNHDWIKNSDLSASLKASLQEIYDKRFQGEHYYIALQPGVQNPEFNNENAYSDLAYPDSGFRLLALYKYWNMIQYYFPYKHLTNTHWEQVLQKYIPLFVQASSELEYELAALQLIGEVNDTHANLWGGGDKITELWGNNFAAFRAEFVENKLVVTDYYNPEFAEKSKLKLGDIITHINGKPVERLVDSLRRYYPASNDAAMLRNMSVDLLRSDKQTISLDYLSEGVTLQHELTLFEREKLKMYRWYRDNDTEKCYKILDGNIGYITLANIKSEDIAEIKKTLKDTKGIIIDQRNYPSTFVPFLLGSYFMSSPTPFVKFTKGNLNNPGEFTFTENLNIPKHVKSYTNKVVVLVNEKSQSQAEYTAMAFRAADNTTIMGSTTAGADGNVSTILLPGGLRTMISGIGVYYPDGKETQRVGIVPDIEVKPSIEGIKQKRDELLEKAIAFINQ